MWGEQYGEYAYWSYIFMFECKGLRGKLAQCVSSHLYVHHFQAQWYRVLGKKLFYCIKNDNFWLWIYQPGEKCSLQIHNRFSRSRGVQFTMGPLSIPNAVGIILAHGHPGSALNRNVDVWMTRDGGYKWNKVRSRKDRSPLRPLIYRVTQRFIVRGSYVTRSNDGCKGF